MNKETARRASAIIEKALGLVEDDLREAGVVAVVRGGSFTDAYAMLKMEIADIGENGAATSKEAEDFKRLACRFGLKPGMLGQKFETPKGSYEVVGLKSRARRYPVIAKNEAGERYAFGAQLVARLLGATKA